MTREIKYVDMMRAVANDWCRARSKDGSMDLQCGGEGNFEREQLLGALGGSR